MRTSSNSPATFGGASVSLGHALSTLGQSLLARARGLWDAYWDYQARRATVLILESLDDRALKDIGLGRSEIGPAVFGHDHTRARPYEPHWQTASIP